MSIFPISVMVFNFDNLVKVLPENFLFCECVACSPLCFRFLLNSSHLDSVKGMARMVLEPAGTSLVLCLSAELCLVVPSLKIFFLFYLMSDMLVFYQLTGRCIYYSC